MSLALIEESAKEVRRLAIAGSPLAVGDFRLKKLIPPIEQAGAKVPVFVQVAKAMDDVVNGPEKESAPRLLNLSTLLNAILYTQGQSSTDASFRELETFPTKCASTRTTARVLKPLVQALTSSGGGRFEVIKSAFERGSFNDLRLIDPAIRALGDNFPEIADFVAEKVLPGFGPGIVPRLKATLDFKGKRQDARKLAVIHELDPLGTLDLCKTALDDGSAEVKAAAVSCLGKHEECLPLVLEQANGKNKQLRAAALAALAEHDRPEITTLFTELVKGKALDLLAGPFRRLKNRQVLNSLVEEGKRVFGLLLKNESEQISRFWEILDCLEQRKDTEVEDFLLGCLANAEKMPKLKAAQNSIFGGAEVLSRIVTLLYNIGSPKALEAVLAKRNHLPGSAFPQVLRTALRCWPPEKVFQEFSPLLEQKKGAGKERNEELQRTIWACCQGEERALFETHLEEAEALKQVVWDLRWIDAAIKMDEHGIVCALIKPGHKAAMDYLLKLLEAKKQYQSSAVIEALARAQYPNVSDVFLDQVAKKTRSTSQYVDLELRLLFESARFLPPADLPKLDAFASKLQDKFVDDFLLAITPLRPTKQSPASDGETQAPAEP